MSHPYAWAIPGTKVVCVNDDFGFVQQGEYVFPSRKPTLNEILTIREVEPGQETALCYDPNGIFLFFWEIERRQVSGPLSGEISWSVECFRPLTERPTDIAIFERLLNPAKQTEDA